MSPVPMDDTSSTVSPRAVDPMHVEHRGRRLVSFGGCDYLRLSWHPSVRQAARDAIDRWGLDAAASRTTTGNLALYGELEKSLARFFRAEAALLTPSGYLAPIVAAQAMAGRFSHALLDDGSHGCLHDAAGMLGCPVVRFRRDDPEALAAAAHGCGAGAKLLVLAHGLSPLDGSVRPLDRYLAAVPSDAWMLVDDAHGAGVLGPKGRGAVESLGLDRSRVVLTVTLSKAFGCHGGAVLGPRWLRASAFATSRAFGGGTPLPPPMAAAALEAVRVMQDSGPARARLAANAARVREVLTGPDADPVLRPGPMFCVAPATTAGSARLRRGLLAAGIFPPLIRYRNGPAAHFFRFAVSSAHGGEPIGRLRDVLARFLATER